MQKLASLENEGKNNYVRKALVKRVISRKGVQWRMKNI